MDCAGGPSLHVTVPIPVHAWRWIARDIVAGAGVIAGQLMIAILESHHCSLDRTLLCHDVAHTGVLDQLLTGDDHLDHQADDDDYDSGLDQRVSVRRLRDATAVVALERPRLTKPA